MSASPLEAELGMRDPYEEAYEALVERGYKVDRPTRHQLQVLKWSFYPRTGTIVYGDQCKEEKGLQALLRMLAKEDGSEGLCAVDEGE